MEENNIPEAKIGVYVCHCGGNISNTVDVEKVVAAAAEMPGVAVARENIFMCSDPGQDLIINDINQENINRVVVAACAPSLHEITFRNAILRTGLNPYLYVHANIREQVSFVHKGEEATEKAISIVAAAVGKVSEILPLEPTSVGVLDHVTVVGAGIAGLKSALDMAKTGLRVALVEKSPFLGGQTALLDKLYPYGDRAGEVIITLAKEVIEHPGIEIYTCSEITRQEGYIGNFNLTILQNSMSPADSAQKVSVDNEFIPFTGVPYGTNREGSKEYKIDTGAIVIATGFSPYVPREGEYGYKQFPEVVTLRDLIRILAENKSSGQYIEINGKSVRSIAMIHCVGSRQIKGIHEPDEKGNINENCSRTCCNGLLNSAIEIKNRYPDTAIFNIYRDIRTYGRFHEEMYAEASAKDVRFIRFSEENQPAVKGNGNDYALSVLVRDTLLENEEFEVPVDMVVLATGMLPGEIDPLIDLLKIHCGADGFLLEVHPKLRPVEVFTAGIYLAGSCQAPMDVTEAVAAASAAAAKASSLLSSGNIKLDPFIATVDEELCVKCLTCVRACPFDIPIIEEEAAYINPAACYGCGACVSACPGGAISLAQYDNDEINSQVKGALKPGTVNIENTEITAGG